MYSIGRTGKIVAVAEIVRHRLGPYVLAETHEHDCKGGQGKDRGASCSQLLARACLNYQTELFRWERWPARSHVSNVDVLAS